MNRISIILIICTVALLTSTTPILANPPNKAVQEDRKEYLKIESKPIKYERKIRKKERKHSEKLVNKRHQYLALMYMWVSNKRR